MNQNYYPIDFQAQYQETSQKMLEITNKYKDQIRTIKPASQLELQQQVEELQAQIDDHQLQFRKQPIYSQFASGQQMAERRKQPPEMCPECGEELKKQVQCQFCAQLFCNKCCCRKRVIPFVSKDIHLCCEQCHWKFVKLFDNKNFYEEKEKLANVINFVKNKINKISEKVATKSQEVEEIRKVRRDEKIKEKAFDNKIIQEEKKLRQLEEELRKVVSEKAQRIQEEERRKKREEEEREKARKAEEERQRAQKEQKEREEQRLRKLKELQEQQNLSASQKKIQAQKIEGESKERQLIEAFKRKQEDLRRREEQLLRKEQEIKRQVESNEIKSVRSSTSINKAETPKQSIGKNSSEKEKMIDTADSKSVSRSRRGSEQQARRLLQSRPQNLVRTESTKSTTEQPSAKKYTIKEEKQQKIQEQPSDSLERSLVNMFKPKKDDDTKSVQSNLSKISKSILDMSVNELLTVRIPVTARVSSKSEIEEKPAQVEVDIVEEEVPATPTRRTLQHRQSLKDTEEKIDEQQVRMNKDSILRNSSLITSGSKATTVQEEVAPNKCACNIM